MSLIAAGLGVSGYLLLRTFALIGGSVPDGIDPCSTVFGAGCDSVLLSSSSWWLGIPLAGWGGIYFATIASLVLLAWGVGEAFSRDALAGAMGLALCGACVSVVLTVVLVSGRLTLCPLCLVVHAVNLSLVGSLLWLSGLSIRELVAAWGRAGRYLIGGKSDHPQEARWKLLGFFSAALVATVAYQWVLIESDRRLTASTGKINPQQVLSAYAQESAREIRVSDSDPRLGSADAPVQLVVFTSFGCPACQRFSSVLRDLSSQFGDRLAIVFKHYPLAASCNPKLKRDKFPLACEAAFAAEAAHRQGKFWRFHDQLFQSDVGLTESLLQRSARQSGLNLARFQQNRNAADISAKVRADVEQAIQLRVSATPTVFLNRKQVRMISRQVLEILIRQQIVESKR